MPLAVGSKVRIKQPKVPAVTWRVTEIEPGRSFTWTATSPGLTTVAEHRITPLGPAAVEVRLGIRRSGPLARLVSALSWSARRVPRTAGRRSGFLGPAPG